MSLDKALPDHIKWATVGMLLAFLGGGSGGWLHDKYAGPPAIPDRFTATQFEIEKRELRQEYDQRLESMQQQLKTFVVAAMELQKRDLELTIKEVEQAIRDKLPPEGTRSRIRAIEGFLKNQHEYQPPTYDWH